MAATVVPVSGGWGGPWIWRDVIKGLDARGVASRAAELPTVIDAAPNLDFRDDAALVRAVIDAIDGSVVLAPMSLGSDLTAKVPASSWKTIPATYVVATEDLAIKPESELQWAKERAADYIEWSSDHCPHISRPDDVADLPARLASDIG